MGQGVTPTPTISIVFHTVSYGDYQKALIRRELLWQLLPDFAVDLLATVTSLQLPSQIVIRVDLGINNEVLVLITIPLLKLQVQEIVPGADGTVIAQTLLRSAHRQLEGSNFSVN